MTLTLVRSTVVLVLALIGVQPGLAQELNIVGKYRCEGANPDGTPYRAVVEIEKDGQTYVVRWISRTPAIGIGIINGEQLSVAYTGGTGIGVVVYRIEKGPRLTGQWTLLGADGRLYRETLTKIGLAAEGSGGSNDATSVGELADGRRPRPSSDYSNNDRLIVVGSGSIP